MTIAYTLEQAETDLRNVYWLIRATRIRNWKHVNNARAIKAAMRMMGVKKREIDDAMYCLRNFDCQRCNKNAGINLPCHEIGKRREEAAKARDREID